METTKLSIEMISKNNIITMPSGQTYILHSFLNAVEEFNKICPKIGFKLNRKHIAHSKEKTHITKLLKYKNNKLIITIEPLIKLENAIVKPIILTPLQIRSGVKTEKKVLSIYNIYLEF